MKKVEKICLILSWILVLIANVSGADDRFVILEMMGIKGNVWHLSTGDSSWVLTLDSLGQTELVRKQVKIDTATVSDIYDDTYNERWLSIQDLDQNLRPILIFQGLNHLTPGQIETAARGREMIMPGDTVIARFSWSKDYELTATGNYQNYYMPDYQMQLRNFNVSPPAIQTIISRRSVLKGENEPRLLWAGDLDQDQKMDFIIRDYTYEVLGGCVLFLSSAAGDSLIVKNVGGVMVPMGC